MWGSARTRITSGWPRRCRTGITSTTEPTTMAPVAPACWPWRGLTRKAPPRAYGPSAASSSRGWPAKRRDGGARNTYGISIHRSDEGGGQPEYGHDRAHQGTGFHRFRRHPRAGEPGRDSAGGSEHLERRSGEDHRDRERELSENDAQSLLRCDGARRDARQSGAATQGTAHLLSQRPLQLRQDGHPHRFLYDGAAPGLSPGHGHAGQDRLQTDAGGVEDDGRGGVGAGHAGGPSGAEYQTPGAVGEGHENCEGPEMGDRHSGAGAASGDAVLARKGRLTIVPEGQVPLRFPYNERCP